MAFEMKQRSEILKRVKANAERGAKIKQALSEQKVKQEVARSGLYDSSGVISTSSGVTVPKSST